MQDTLQHLYQIDPGTQSRKERSELAAYRTAADNRNIGGHPFDPEDLLGIKYPFLLGSGRSENPRRRSGRDDKCPRIYLFIANRNSLPIQKRSLALYDLYLPGPERPVELALKAIHDISGTFPNQGKAEVNSFRGYPEFAGAPEFIVKKSGF